MQGNAIQVDADNTRKGGDVLAVVVYAICVESGRLDDDLAEISY